MDGGPGELHLGTCGGDAEVPATLGSHQRWRQLLGQAAAGVDGEMLRKMGNELKTKTNQSGDRKPPASLHRSPATKVSLETWSRRS